MAGIVVGVDGSEESFVAAQWAAQEAARRGTTLTIVHAYGLGKIGRYLLGDAIGTSYENDVRKSDADDLVRAVASRLAADVGGLPEVRTETMPGKVADDLAAAAKDADLLVIGTHGAGTAKTMVLGSVAAALPRVSTCPVVIVPPAAVRAEHPAS